MDHMVWGIVNVVKDFIIDTLDEFVHNCNWIDRNNHHDYPYIFRVEGGGGGGDAGLSIYLATFLMAIRKQIVSWILYVLF
jgi:hypothetical protein